MSKIKNHKRVCTICGQAFGQDRSLIRHLNNEHGFVDTPQNLYNLLVLENVVPVCKCNTCNLLMVIADSYLLFLMKRLMKFVRRGSLLKRKMLNPVGTKD